MKNFKAFALVGISFLATKSDAVKIKQIEIYGDGIKVALQTPISPGPCTDGGWAIWLQTGTDGTLANRYVAGLLAAKSNGWDISGWSSGQCRDWDAPKRHVIWNSLWIL